MLELLYYYSLYLGLELDSYRLYYISIDKNALVFSMNKNITRYTFPVLPMNKIYYARVLLNSGM